MLCFRQNMDHVQQKLVFTTFALEAMKMEANDELKKYKEYIKYQGGLLEVAYQERDEFRKQLQKVLDNLATPNGIVTNCLTRANSSNSESNNSYGSPTDDSFVSSPDSTNMAPAIVRNQPYKNHGSVSITGAVASKEYDLIDDLCRGLALPQTGSLLKVMMNSGPLLSSLLVSGPLPQWKNPPPLQTLKILPFPINASHVGSNMCSTVSLMSLGSGSSWEYQKDNRVRTSAVATGLSGYARVAKRQRFQ